MKKLLVILTSLLLVSFIKWQPNFDIAKKIARENHKLILLNFSGSDWCGPCIRLHKEIFESEVFSKMADTSLVMINADFPRERKDRLDPETQKQNDALADKYNPDGKFPYTLLLDPNGNVIQSWEGFPNMSAADFADEINDICMSRKYYADQYPH
jgi:thioredoxin-related protein